MSRDRCFIGTVYDLVEAACSIENPNRSHTNGRSATIMVSRDPRGISGLMKFPKRLDTGMYALGASQQFTTDADMLHIPVGDNSSRDSNGPLCVVGCLSDPPLTLRIANISRDDGAGDPFETSDAIRVPVQDVF